MIVAFIISLVVAGSFFFLWQEEHEKLVKAEKQIKDLKRQLKRTQTKSASPKTRSSEFLTLEKSKDVREYVIKKPQPQLAKPLLDQKKLADLREQTRESQDMLAEIFIHEEDIPVADSATSDNRQIMDILLKLFDKEVWTRSEIQELVGLDIMIGSLLEQINDYSCSKIDDIVVEEDGEKIYVTTEYKEQLI
jgi:hypothetical protein